VGAQGCISDVISLRALVLSRFVCRWHAVAVWQWDANEDVCGICRMAFDACCPDCRVPGDGCPPVWGQCNHVYHMHCIMKNIRVHSESNRAAVCPMCRQEWQFKAVEE
jgi:anaphase-promoting complex subunit 11